MSKLFTTLPLVCAVLISQVQLFGQADVGRQSEALGTAASQSLAEWVAPFIAPGGVDGVILDTEKTQLPGVLIERGTAPITKEFAKQLRLPEAAFAGKVTRIKQEGDSSLTTDHLLYFTRDRRGQHLERKATCTAKWKIVPGSAPTLESIVLPTIETVTSSGRLEDHTAAALGENFGLPGLSKSNTYWRNHIEKSKGPGLFGQNGLAVVDINGDGLDDVYHCQLGGVPNELLLQQKDGTFALANEQCGLDIFDETRGALFVDFDNDGDQDCALSTIRRVAIFKNDGDGHFTQAFSLKVAGAAHSLAASDYDLDGDVDLFVCGYYGRDQDTNELPIPYPIFNATNGGRNILLRNDGALKFSDVTNESGLDKDNRRYSFAAIWEDFDNDGDADLYTANDFGRDTLHRNTKGKFVDISDAAGLNRGAFGMGVSSADFDHDGKMDVYVANMFSAAGSRISRQDWFKSGQSEAVRASYRHLARGNTLLKNLSGNTFEDVSIAQGVEMGRFSWGVQFCDLNNDSWDDLLVANGYVTGRDPDDL